MIVKRRIQNTHMKKAFCKLRGHEITPLLNPNHNRIGTHNKNQWIAAFWYVVVVFHLFTNTNNPTANTAPFAVGHATNGNQSLSPKGSPFPISLSPPRLCHPQEGVVMNNSTNNQTRSPPQEKPSGEGTFLISTKIFKNAA